MTTRRGCFITLEGLEGAGKTSNRQIIIETLEQADVPVISTREPGGTVLGESLRSLVLQGPPLSARAELLLMVAARLENVQQIIEPALADGQWVLADRFVDASFAYQGGGRELGAVLVARLHALLGLDLQPDLTLLLDLPVAAGRLRQQRRSAPDRIELEADAFFERARAAYLQRAAQSPSRVQVIDAGAAPEQVAVSIRASVQGLLRRYRMGTA